MPTQIIAGTVIDTGTWTAPLALTGGVVKVELWGRGGESASGGGETGGGGGAGYVVIDAYPVTPGDDYDYEFSLDSTDWGTNIDPGNFPYAEDGEDVVGTTGGTGGGGYAGPYTGTVATGGVGANSTAGVPGGGGASGGPNGNGASASGPTGGVGDADSGSGGDSGIAGDTPGGGAGGLMEPGISNGGNPQIRLTWAEAGPTLPGPVSSPLGKQRIVNINQSVCRAAHW